MFNGPPLAGSAVAQAADPASLINNILYGPEIPEVLGAFGGWETMKPYAEVLDDEEIAAVATYVRGSWENRGGPVTAAQVRRQR
jgi:mono/diheme cytochrome c family protein